MKDTIRKYVGKEYKHNGRDDQLDCLGLVISFLKDNGIYLPSDDGEDIKKEWFKENPRRLIEGLSNHGKRISLNKLQPLDVVVFSFRGIPRHAGVTTDRSHFIHAREGKKVAIIRLKHYKKFFHSGWRIESEVN
jgi:cell wall-associated NlpC family hydrolase